MNPQKPTTATIQTSLGRIVVRLFDETPLHRSNFIRLAESGALSGTLFHRVIQDFMIQAGDLSTRPEDNDTSAIEQEFSELTPAEITFPLHFHKRGALAAARTADEVNPERKSSPTQFYIVTGQTWNKADLANLQKQKLERYKQLLLKQLQDENRTTMKELYRRGDKQALANLRETLITQAEAKFQETAHTARFTDQQIATYQNEGGAPHLDGEYTVFGEVVQGMDIVDKIQQVPTTRNDKPLTDIQIISVVMG